MKILFTLFLSIIASQVYAVSSEKQHELITEAGKLLKDSQARQAWTLLSRHEYEYAGNAGFDYVLGMAALADGRYTEATIAFERVLIVNPDHIGARLDSGLAYLKLGNNGRAYLLFNEVLGLNPPEQIRVVAEQGLVLAQRKQDGSGIRLTRNLKSYIAMSAGTDSNINTTTSNPTALLFGFLPVTLNTTATPDQYANLNAGMTYQLPVSDISQWEFSMNANLFAPRNHNEYQNLNGGASVTYQQFSDDSRWSIGGNAGHSWLDEDDYLAYQGALLGWRHAVNDGNLLDVSTSWTQYRYEESAQSINDFDQTLIAGRLLHRVPGKPLIAAFGLLGGYADAINGSADGDKQFFGAAFGLQGQVRYADSAFFNVGWKKSLYEKSNVAFLRHREDSQLDMRAGLSWNLPDNWILTGEIGVTSVNSNISIYSYERNKTALTLRKDFSH
jgi:tetratricopeptide (TPR) repeat protein